MPLSPLARNTARYPDLAYIQANPSPSQALDNATILGAAPRSAIAVIARALYEKDADQANVANALRIVELREEQRRSNILKIITAFPYVVIINR